MTDEATREGVSEEVQEPTKNENPRDAAVEDLAEKLEKQRAEELAAQIKVDPGLAQTEEAMQREMADAEGLASIEPIEEEEEEEEEEPGEEPAAEEPGEEPAAKDPLEDFIVMKDGQPMVALNVYGEERLLPVDQARAQLQKREAAEIGLQQANEIRKQLDVRARAIEAREEELKTRATIQHNPPSDNADVDDAALKREANSVVKTLFSGTEEEAADELVRLLKVRTPAQAPIDVDAVVTEAAQAAKRELRKEELEIDSKKGYAKFVSEYQDINDDDYLFKVADSMTETISQENPEMTPSEVMLEAGKRTREWWATRPGAEAAPQENNEADLAQRQSRKKQLRPMPRPATATQETPAEEAAETPQDVIQQMREARNQPT